MTQAEIASLTPAQISAIVHAWIQTLPPYEPEEEAPEGGDEASWDEEAEEAADEAFAEDYDA